MAKVRVNEVSKTFGNVTALNSISLEVRDKEFAVLLGPSGCGKTTALRCIAGLESPDGGEIYIGDALVNELPPKDRDVAVVFQSYALYPHKSVYGNLAFPLQVRGQSKQTTSQKVREVAQLLKIEHLLDRKPRQLSGGEQQRVALGRALVREPKVFLMDEPLSNLDAKLRMYMRAELKRLHRELGITTIYVTHDQAEAMTMADRIAVLNKGVLKQVATPDEIYNNPGDAFVADFLGSPPMNLIEASLVGKDPELYLEFSAFKYHLPHNLQEAVVKSAGINSRVTLGIRPEDIVLSKEKATEHDIKMELYVLEPLGSELVVDLKLREIVIKAKTRPDFRGSVGEEVYVTFDPLKVHLFDSSTGKSIR